MKLLILIFIFTFLSFVKNTITKDKIVVLFYQQEELRPLAISKDDFWSFKQDFDTVEIASKNLMKRIENKISLFKLTRFQDLNYQAALVRYKNGNISDTIYSDRFFQYWLINKKVYEDTSRYFEKLFVNFYKEQLR